MTKRRRGAGWDVDATTSYLDLLCCGFGAVALLFMIVIALKDKIRFDKPEPPGAQAGPTAPLAVSVVLRGLGSGALFDTREVLEPGFRIQGPSPVVRHQSHSNTHALILLESPPPPGSRLLLGPIARRAVAEVRVLANGKLLWSPVIDTRDTPRDDKALTLNNGVDEQGMVDIWPRALAQGAIAPAITTAPQEQ